MRKPRRNRAQVAGVPTAGWDLASFKDVATAAVTW
jgi:hypothetical protein